LGPDPRRALGPAATPAASTGRTRDRTRPMLQSVRKHLPGHRPHVTQCMVRPCVAREFRRVGGSGLASMYPAFGWSISLLAIMGISAPVISLAERPRGPFGSPVFASAGKTEPPSRLVLSQTSVGLAGASYAGSMTTRPEACSPRSPGREPVHSRRCERACWQARSPARCGAAASWPPRSRL